MGGLQGLAMGVIIDKTTKDGNIARERGGMWKGTLHYILKLKGLRLKDNAARPERRRRRKKERKGKR